MKTIDWNRRNANTWVIFILFGLLTGAIALAHHYYRSAKEARNEAGAARELIKHLAQQSPTQATSLRGSPRFIPADTASVSPPDPDSRDREIAELKARIESLLQAAAETNAPTARPGWAARMQQWQARMREQDPALLEHRRAEARERLAGVAELTYERLEFMKQVSAEGLAPEYQENHQALLGRLEFFNDAMQTISNDPESAESMALLPQVFMNVRGLDNMLAMQRTVLLDDMARDMGYADEQAEQFVSQVNRITEATTLPSPSFFQRSPREQPPQDGPKTVIIP